MSDDLFIEKAYKERLKNQKSDDKAKPGTAAATTNHPTHGRRHTAESRRFVIGSIRTGKKDYAPDEHFWGKEAVPGDARQAVIEMKNLADPDHLGLRKKAWNISAQVPRNPNAEESFHRKLIKVRMGLMDQPLVRMKLPRIEAGTDTRDDYTGWNVSTQQDLRDRNRLLETL